MKRVRKLATLTAVLVALVLVALNVRIGYAEPQSAPRTTGYSIDWWTVDGGGGQALTGGPYTLSGTVGQPDAGAQTGTGYALSGGFWYVDVFGYRIDLPLIRK